MQNSDLQDLILSGVQWELDNVPTAMRSKIIAASAISQQNTQSGAQSGATRTATTIVPPISPIQSVTTEIASAMAMRPTNMDEMLRMVAEFNHPLRNNAKNVVLPSVATKPNGLVIITDIPGVDDDASSHLMSGAPGELLDKMLAAIGMSRANVSIVPMLFWRTPGGRTPNRTELDLSRPFVDRIIEMLAPKIIITFGTLPAQELCGVKVANAQGNIQNLDNGCRLMPLYHPNYLILKPSAKRDVWNALQNVQNLLKNQDN